MLKCRLKCVMLIILVLNLRKGSALSVAELTPQHSEETIRQVKSEEMFKYLNLSADPCEDFYQFTCGNFAKFNPLSEEEGAIGIGEILAKLMDAKIQQELNNDYATDTAADKNVKNFYRSCLNVPTSTLSSSYPEQLKEMLREFGEMPLFEGYSWQRDDFDWTKSLAQIIHKTGLGIIFEIRVVPDFYNNTVNRVAIGEPKLPWGERSFYVDEVFEDEREMRIQMISFYLQNYFQVEEELALKTAYEMFSLEVGLANFMADIKSDIQPTELYSLTPIEELQRQYEHVADLMLLVMGAMGESASAHTDLYVQTNYVQGVFEVLKVFPKRVVANYLYYSYLTNFIFTPEQTGNDVESYCLTETKKYFFKNVDNMIYRKYYKDQAEKTVYSIWRELKMAFRNILYSPRLDWLQEDTRLEAVQKLKTLKLRILSYENAEFLQEVEHLHLNAQDYVQNIEAILTLLGDLARARLTKPAEGVELGAEAATTPVHKVAENLVEIPIGFLQPYYIWSSAFPSAVNFAYLGFFIAHEIIHGFDDFGRNYDALGNVRNWWNPLTDQEFRERTQCFVDQYKELIYEGHQLPEMKMQAENIADGGGMRLAYEAYLMWYHRLSISGHSMVNESLPDFSSFNHQQLFFIASGQIWCSNYDESVVAAQLADTHTPNPLRTIGPLANFDEFSKVFNCPLGSGMNPDKKCIIY